MRSQGVARAVHGSLDAKYVAWSATSLPAPTKDSGLGRAGRRCRTGEPGPRGRMAQRSSKRMALRAVEARLDLLGPVGAELGGDGSRRRARRSRILRRVRRPGAVTPSSVSIVAGGGGQHAVLAPVTFSGEGVERRGIHARHRRLRRRRSAWRRPRPWSCRDQGHRIVDELHRRRPHSAAASGGQAWPGHRHASEAPSRVSSSRVSAVTCGNPACAELPRAGHAFARCARALTPAAPNSLRSAVT